MYFWPPGKTTNVQRSLIPTEKFSLFRSMPVVDMLWWNNIIVFLTRRSRHAHHLSLLPCCTDLSELAVFSPDTYVFRLFYFANDISTPIFLPMGTGVQHRVINIMTANHIHDRSIITALFSLHAFTGCDTRAFLQKEEKPDLWKWSR